MSAKLLWERGGEATITSLTLDTVSLVSTVPSPPGSRIEGTLADDASVMLKVKIHGSKRQADGSFALVGRPVDMPRDVREKLAARIG